MIGLEVSSSSSYADVLWARHVIFLVDCITSPKEANFESVQNFYLFSSTETVKGLCKIHCFRCVWNFLIAPYFLLRKVMQGLFSVLETELQSYIHFADRLDNL